MKKLLIIIALYISAIATATAQNDNSPNDKGRLQAFKIAFLTKKLDLTPEEAQRFWPIYNNYQSEIRNARINKKQNNANEIENQERILNIRKKYNVDFSRVLSAEKVNTLFRSEKEFGNVVQKELMERKQRNSFNR